MQVRLFASMLGMVFVNEHNSQVNAVKLVSVTEGPMDDLGCAMIDACADHMRESCFNSDENDGCDFSCGEKNGRYQCEGGIFNPGGVIKSMAQGCNCLFNNAFK